MRKATTNSWGKNMKEKSPWDWVMPVCWILAAILLLGISLLGLTWFS
jgi:hypothetical protein